MKFLLLFIYFHISIASAFSQPINNVYVLTEIGDDDFRKCNLNFEGLAASGKSALRYNRIQVSNNELEDLTLYINAQVIPLVNGNCAASLTVQFKKYNYINLPKGTIFVPGILCERIGVAVFSSSNIQIRLNEQTKQIVDVCVSQIEKNLKR